MSIYIDSSRISRHVFIVLQHIECGRTKRLRSWHLSEISIYDWNPPNNPAENIRKRPGKQSCYMSGWKNSQHWLGRAVSDNWNPSRRSARP